jgi:flagellar M-ring protein FliF
MTDVFASLKSMASPLAGYWQAQSAGRRRVLVALVLSLVVISSFLAWFLNRAQYEVLYTGLPAAEAGAILQQLAERKIDARPRGLDTILVPREQVDALRMDLAAAGYPKGSGTNLDILQQGTGFGMTEEDKEIYRRYQLQQDLQAAIETFASVSEARVSLNIPKKSSFVIENRPTPATAAVLLTLKPGAQLSTANVEAIAQLVEKSVPDLQPESISIIDSQMNVLNRQPAGQDLETGDQLSLEAQVRDRLRSQVLALLQPVFGIDKVLAEVSVRLDFDVQMVESIRFEPMDGGDTGMISTIEKIRDVASKGGGAVGEGGTGTNGADIPVYPVAETADAVYEKNSEKISYEINTIKESLTKAKGSVRELSVSVVLDGNAVQAAGYADSVKALVSGAVGVPVESITVEALPFNGQADLDRALADYRTVSELGQRQERLQFTVITASAGALALLIILSLLVLIGRGKKDDAHPAGRSKANEHPSDPAEASGQDEIYEMFPSLNPANRQVSSNFSIHLQPELRLEPDDEKTSAIKYVRDNPELAANIIRGWLAEEPG